VPEKLIQQKAGGFKKIIMLEMNMGQYIGEVKKVLPKKDVQFYGQMSDVLITPKTIMKIIENE
jgi:2-oxoglutarate/2-oxoacid ferredoxin oxidoreductase subunit alpha